MNFDFSEDQKFLQKTARDYLAEHSDLAVCRDVLECEQAYDRDLWKGVAEMGWLGAVVPEELRRRRARLPRARADRRGDRPRARADPLLARRSTSRPRRCCAWAATSRRRSACRGSRSGDADRHLRAGRGRRRSRRPASRRRRFAKAASSRGTKLPVPDGDVAGPRRGRSPARARGHEPRARRARRAGRRRADRARVLRPDALASAQLEFEGAPAELLGDGGPRRGARRGAARPRRGDAWPSSRSAAPSARSRSRASSRIGRYAFGRPVASFQALKHRMADLYAAIELARSNGFYGAWALSTTRRSSRSRRLRRASRRARPSSSPARR